MCFGRMPAGVHLLHLLILESACPTAQGDLSALMTPPCEAPDEGRLFAFVGTPTVQTDVKSNMNDIMRHHVTSMIMKELLFFALYDLYAPPFSFGMSDGHMLPYYIALKLLKPTHLRSCFATVWWRNFFVPRVGGSAPQLLCGLVMRTSCSNLAKEEETNLNRQTNSMFDAFLNGQGQEMAEIWGHHT